MVLQAMGGFEIGRMIAGPRSLSQSHAEGHLSSAVDWGPAVPNIE